MKGTLSSKYSWWDFLFTFGGLLFFLADIVLDAWAVVRFYQEGAYVSLGLLLLFLLGSSVLGQVYSCLWYHYDDYETHTKVEGCLNRLSIKLLHVILLGVYLRYVCVMEVAVLSFISKKSRHPEHIAVYLSHDLSMLRLIETFTEGAPQLVLMLTVILQKGMLDPMTVLKAAGSASTIACSVTMYHRSLRSFLPDKDEQQICSSLIYFLWNLLLIAPRITALTLFASVLPCYIFTHFICSWTLLSFCAWRAKTNFMDSAGGEWLFRATVGLIWYFSWFNVVEGKTRYRSLLYHLYIMVDVVVLCGLWCWQIYSERPYFEETPFYAVITGGIIVVVYILGLLVKGVYYKYFHPKIIIKESVTEESPALRDADIVDGSDMSLETDSGVKPRSIDSPTQPVQKRENKRMRKLAENFYA